MPSLFQPGMRAILAAVRPDHGGRFELKLSESTGTTARYELVISTALVEVSTIAQVNAESGTVEIGTWPEPAPLAWLEAFARTLLRTVLRNKASDGQWPRRLTRWRPEPSARGSGPAD